MERHPHEEFDDAPIHCRSTPIDQTSPGARSPIRPDMRPSTYDAVASFRHTGRVAIMVAAAAPVEPVGSHAAANGGAEQDDQLLCQGREKAPPSALAGLKASSLAERRGSSPYGSLPSHEVRPSFRFWPP